MLSRRSRNACLRMRPEFYEFQIRFSRATLTNFCLRIAKRSSIDEVNCALIPEFAPEQCERFNILEKPFMPRIVGFDLDDRVVIPRTRHVYEQIRRIPWTIPEVRMQPFVDLSVEKIVTLGRPA